MWQFLVGKNAMKGKGRDMMSLLSRPQTPQAPSNQGDLSPNMPGMPQPTQSKALEYMDFMSNLKERSPVGRITDILRQFGILR